MLVLAVILLGMREDLVEATEALEHGRVAYYHVAAKYTSGASESVQSLKGQLARAAIEGNRTTAHGAAIPQESKAGSPYTNGPRTWPSLLGPPRQLMQIGRAHDSTSTAIRALARGLRPGGRATPAAGPLWPICSRGSA